MITIEIKILLTSGTTSIYDAFTIENVETYHSSSSGYYYIKTHDGIEHYLPVSKTILKVNRN